MKELAVVYDYSLPAAVGGGLSAKTSLDLRLSLHGGISLEEGRRLTPLGRLLSITSLEWKQTSCGRDIQFANDR